MALFLSALPPFRMNSEFNAGIIWSRVINKSCWGGGGGRGGAGDGAHLIERGKVRWFSNPYNSIL